MNAAWDRRTVYGGLAKLAAVLGVALAAVYFVHRNDRILEAGWHEFAGGRLRLLLSEGGEDLTGVHGVPNPGTRVVSAERGVRVHSWVERLETDVEQVLALFDDPQPVDVDGARAAWLLHDLTPPSPGYLVLVIDDGHACYMAFDPRPDDAESAAAARELMEWLRLE